MSSLFVLLHLPQCVEIIALNGVSTSLIGFQHLTPLSKDTEGSSISASQQWQ